MNQLISKLSQSLSSQSGQSTEQRIELHHSVRDRGGEMVHSQIVDKKSKETTSHVTNPFTLPVSLKELQTAEGVSIGQWRRPTEVDEPSQEMDNSEPEGHSNVNSSTNPEAQLASK
jgi:hypothetical protein